ncbi:hypothetical protein D5S17_35010 [Pseudonocardiaceae bacterium YIM PH 21723]|nr:hypothetical protein D5S17_35010 [Pseudonocardiaceae bacterium YIM PH 21723]
MSPAHTGTQWVLDLDDQEIRALFDALISTSWGPDFPGSSRQMGTVPPEGAPGAQAVALDSQQRPTVHTVTTDSGWRGWRSPPAPPRQRSPPGGTLSLDS